jgi:hypothetical protein
MLVPLLMEDFKVIKKLLFFLVAMASALTILLSSNDILLTALAVLLFVFSINIICE